ncbi:hypothetical protein ACFV4K_13900 [Nocardia sp. NPDC059764]|uniref:hypothetical protein n=1 Tax=Nocardia sp. NPDC059764 TaxID=3346939 RepID=UPI00364CAFCC
MKASQTYSLLARLLDGLEKRLPPNLVEILRIENYGGEWQLCADTLAGTLRGWRIPVTLEEREILSKVLNSFVVPNGENEFINHRDEVIASIPVRKDIIAGTAFQNIASSMPGWDALDCLGEEDFVRLTSMVYSGYRGSQESADWILLSWALGVLWLGDSISEPETRWNSFSAESMVRMLRARDQIAEVVENIDDPLRDRVTDWIDRYDKIYQLITVEDSKLWIAWKAKLKDYNMAWWWRRIPIDGPVVEEYDHFLKEIEKWKKNSKPQGNARPDDTKEA